MDSGEDGKTGNNDDLYGVLGLHKECTSAELKNAYKKLAMRWHPDRCSASGNNKYVEEAKKKFQDIQEAYSVLSDSSKRFLYDVGAYDEDDDDNNNGMGEFLDEMITMMNQTNPTQKQKQECGGGGRKNETFEELQELFDEMFNADTMMKPACAAASSSSSSTLLFSSSSSSKTPSPLYSDQSSTSSIDSTSNLNNSKRNSTHMSYGDQDDYWRGKTSSDINFSSFCFGVEEEHRQQQGRHLKRRVGREPVGRTTTAS